MPLPVLLLFHLNVSWVLVAGVQCAYLSLIRVPVTEVRLFYGQTPLKFTIGGCRVSFGWIPLGSAVSFDPIVARQKPWAMRLPGHFVAPAVCLAAAAALLGFPEAWHQFSSGFRQIPTGAWFPVAVAGGDLSRWYLIAKTSVASGFGVVAAKSAALALLPVGGGVFTQILADVGESTGREALAKLAVWNAMIAMAIMGLWGFAAVFLTIAG